MNLNLTACTSCVAPIWFGVTDTGKTMPLDAQPDYVNGNVYLLYEGGEVVTDGDAPRVRVASKKNPAPEGADRYVSHFATCPNSDFHRRRR